MRKRPERLAIVQYAGDYREAAERLHSGGEENYRAQRYSVEHVEALTHRIGEVAVITGFTTNAHDVVLPSGVRAIGAGFTDRYDANALSSLVERFRPDRLILRTPCRPVMRWAIRQRCPTLMLLADSFQNRSFKGRLSQFVLARALRSKVFEVVGNHGRRAAEQLLEIGVPADKVIAWDYPQFDKPSRFLPKASPSADGRIVYVGMLIEAKGIHDLIRAAAALRDAGRTIRLDVIGKGDVAPLRALIAELELGEAVTLIGLIANTEVVSRMRAADIVVVPSRHEYPEGLPLTIYEAYCSRTPLVVSDHPMFRDNVTHEMTGMIFRAGDAADAARQIGRLLDDPELYSRLSRNAERGWAAMQLPVEWGALIDRWLEGDEASQDWIADHTLAGERRCQRRVNGGLTAG